MLRCSRALRSRKLIGSTSRILMYRPSCRRMMPFLISATGIMSSVSVSFLLRRVGGRLPLRFPRSPIRIPMSSGVSWMTGAPGSERIACKAASECSTRLFMSHFTQLMANSDSESSSMPITPKTPAGSVMRIRMITRVVSGAGILRIGIPVSKTSTQASMALRTRIMPPNRRPLVRKLGGMKYTSRFSSCCSTRVTPRC